MKRILTAAALVALGGVANASITIIVGPGNIFGDENVLYNVGSLIDNGPLVQGITNQSDTIIDNYDAGEDLVTPPGGQARIESGDGSFTDLTISPHETGVEFSTLMLNIDSFDDGSVNFNIDGVDFGNFALDGSGENFFRIIADGGDSFDEFHLSSNVGLEDVQQIRVSVAVPEPASMTALGIGAAALLRRRRKARIG